MKYSTAHLFTILVILAVAWFALAQAKCETNGDCPAGHTCEHRPGGSFCLAPNAVD